MSKLSKNRLLSASGAERAQEEYLEGFKVWNIIAIHEINIETMAEAQQRVIRSIFTIDEISAVIAECFTDDRPLWLDVAIQGAYSHDKRTKKDVVSKINCYVIPAI